MGLENYPPAGRGLDLMLVVVSQEREEREAGSDITMRADGVSILKVGGQQPGDQPARPAQARTELGRPSSL